MERDISKATETSADREFTEQELSAVNGGAIKQPNNSTILINKPTFPRPWDIK